MFRLMSRLIRLLPVLLLSLATAASADLAPPDGLRQNKPSVFALTGATVVPEPGERLEDATVVLRDGRIESVNGEIPLDATTIDLTGHVIYAGFIDAYHEADASNTEPTGHWNDRIHPHVDGTSLPMPDDAHRAGFVARVVAPDRGIFRGKPALRSTNGRVICGDLGQALRLTVDPQPWGKPAKYPRSPMGAVALARQTMYDATWQRDALAAIANDPTLGPIDAAEALVALQPIVDGERPLWVVCDDELFVLRANGFAKEFNVDAVVIASGDEFRRADLVAETGRTLIVPVNFPKAPDVTSPAKVDATDLQTLMAWDIAPSNPAYLYERGMTLAFTSHGLDVVEDFLSNVRRAVVRGLPEDAALAMLTTNPASLCGASDNLGSITSGKLASLTITDGDLFDEETKIVEVWVEGERHQLEKAQTLVEGAWTLDGAVLILTTDGGSLGDAELANVTRSPDGVAFTVDATPLKASGIATVSLTLLDDQLRGTVALPDGTRRTVVATRSQKAQPIGSSPKEPVEAELPTVDAPAREAADGVPTELQTGDGEPGTATPGDAATPDADAEGEILETTPTTLPATRPTSQPTDDRPLFVVNYPLGAYGTTDVAPAEAAPRVFIHNATVWPLDGRQALEGSVRFENGQVEGVYAGVTQSIGGITANEEAVVISGGEGTRHITPGLIDAHSHIATDGGINEGTQAVTCEVRIGDFIDPDDIHLYRQLAGGTTAAQILHGSANPIGGQAQTIKFRWGQGPEQLKFGGAKPAVKWALGENVKQSNWGDDFTTRYPQTRMGVQEIFADSLRAAVEYLEAKADFEQNDGLPVRYDLELEALLEILEGKRIIHCHSYRADEILATMRTLETFGVTMNTFQHILEGYKVAPEMAEHGAMASAFSDWWAFKFEVYDAIPYNGSIMHEAGIVTSFNSDDAELGTRLNTEAAKAVKYGGVSEVEALKFVTLNPAIQLGIDDRVGSLEPGKDADFVVWSGHPLDSTSVVEQTWVDGVKVFDREEHLQAMKRNREMKAALVQKVLASGQPVAEPGENDPRPGTLWPRHDLFCHDGHDHH
jgi:N-acetylglucosamine-6-phosphate deacetylase